MQFNFQSARTAPTCSDVVEDPHHAFIHTIVHPHRRSSPPRWHGRMAFAPLEVVTTTEDLAALTREIGGDR
jgi:hypothetical protein